MRRQLRTALFGMVLLGIASQAAAATIDFESFSDLEVLTNQVPGLTFSNATVLASGAVGGTLNEIDFPPFSPFNVAFDAGGPMVIAFASPVTSVSGFFTHSTGLTFQAFDAANVLVASVSSAIPNLGANEFLSVAAAAISSVVITGDPGGLSFTLDDLTYLADQNPNPNPVPEPGTLALLLTGIVPVLRHARHRRRNI